MLQRIISAKEDIRSRPLLGTNLYRSFITEAPFINQIKECSSLVELEALARVFCIGIDSLFNAIPRIKNEILPAHPFNVSRNAVAIGLAMGLLPETIRCLRYAGLLHDIGKAPIPDGILKAPRKLNDEEREVLRRHPLYSKEIIEQIPWLASREAIIAYLHQERYDGRGYFDFSSSEIPLEAHIVIIADCFDAMVNDRPYHKKISYAEAMDEIVSCERTQFDPEAVQGFLQWAEKGFPEPDLEAINFYDRLMQEVPDNLLSEEKIILIKRLLIELYIGVTDLLVVLSDKRDGLNTRGYQTEESARRCVQLAKAYGLNEQQQRMVYMYGLVGGVYDMYIPDEIEDPKEFRLFARDMTKEILLCIPGYEEWLPVVEDIFEDFDGTSSLSGKKAEEISIEARVARVALTYVQLGVDKVVERRGNILDPDIVDVFLQRIKGMEKKEIVPY